MNDATLAGAAAPEITHENRDTSSTGRQMLGYQSIMPGYYYNIGYGQGYGERAGMVSLLGETLGGPRLTSSRLYAEKHVERKDALASILYSLSGKQ